MSWDDLDERHYSWPSVAAVREYREQVKQVILDVIDHSPITLPIDWESRFLDYHDGNRARTHPSTSWMIRQLPLSKVISGRFGEICKERGETPRDNVTASGTWW